MTFENSLYGVTSGLTRVDDLTVGVAMMFENSLCAFTSNLTGIVGLTVGLAMMLENSLYEIASDLGGVARLLPTNLACLVAELSSVRCSVGTSLK